MESFRLTKEFIHLNQLLKAMAWVSDGASANELIDKGQVKVDGNTEIRRRNKIRRGAIVSWNGLSVKVE